MGIRWNRHPFIDNNDREAMAMNCITWPFKEAKLKIENDKHTVKIPPDFVINPYLITPGDPAIIFKHGFQRRMIAALRLSWTLEKNIAYHRSMNKCI